MGRKKKEKRKEKEKIKADETLGRAADSICSDYPALILRGSHLSDVFSANTLSKPSP
jgi:hypothetical protein